MADERQPEVRLPGQFEAFYRNEYRSVVALTYGLSGNRWAAEDMAQEAFLRAHQDWDRVGRMDAPGAWVRRVAMNLALSSFRRFRSETAARLRLGAAPVSVHPLPADRAEFWAEVQRLPARQAQAIALRYIEDLAMDEIAQLLGTAEGTVKALLHQGRQRLARQLAAKGWVDDETG